MSRGRYYALIGSLPHLPHFESAEYLPITEMQIASRLTLLTAQHRRELDTAATLMFWLRQPRERSTEYLVERYVKAMEEIDNPGLRAFIEFRLGLRTAVVALRMRRAGEAPQAGVPWGVGRWTRKIAAHWDDVDFRLGAVYPCLPRAREFLETGNALGLERLLLDTVWKELTIFEASTPFGFERVFAFVFKWDIVKRWLGYDPEIAKTRFQELTKEAMGDHQNIFA